MNLLLRTEPGELIPGVGSWSAEASLVLLPGVGGHGHSDLQTYCPGQGRRHGVTNLTVPLPDGAMELVGVREALASSILPDTTHPGK